MGIARSRRCFMAARAHGATPDARSARQHARRNLPAMTALSRWRRRRPGRLSPGGARRRPARASLSASTRCSRRSSLAAGTAGVVAHRRGARVRLTVVAGPAIGLWHPRAGAAWHPAAAPDGHRRAGVIRLGARWRPQAARACVRRPARACATGSLPPRPGRRRGIACPTSPRPLPTWARPSRRRARGARLRRGHLPAHRAVAGWARA
jgi:hypothetical protein